MSSLGEITAQKVDQSGPPEEGEFVYVDISSIDNLVKRIVEPKRLPTSLAPSRARQRLQKGDVLVSMTRPNLNAVAMVPSELDGAVGSTGLHVLRAKESIEPHWLYYAVQNRDFVQSMSELVQGALYPAVRPKDIREYSISPPPLEEQRSIVAEIEKQFSRLDEAVANLQRGKANLKRYKAAVLKAAVEGRLVETEAELARRDGRSYETGGQLLQRILEKRCGQWTGRGKYKEPLPHESHGLPKIPEGWAWCSVDAVFAETLIGLDRGRDQQREEAIGSPYVKMNNVNMDGQVLTDDLVYVDVTEEERARYALVRGDLLFNTRNSLELVGKVGLVGTVPTGMVFNNNLMRLRAFDGISTSFLCFQMCAMGFRQRMEKVKKATTSVAAVYQKDFLPLAIAIPPQEEQRRIVAEADRRLSIVREVEAEVDANLKRAQALRQATLSKAFGGPHV